MLNPLLPAGNDRSIYCFDHRTQKATLEIANAHDSNVNSCLFHPTSETELVSAGFDRALRVWDLRNPKEARFVLSGHHKGGR